MLVDFFFHLKAAKLPVSTGEFLTLLDALEHRVISSNMEDFYFLARTCLVKDEALYDRFNLAFGAYFKGVDSVFDIRAGIPEEWVRKLIEGSLTEDEKAMVEALGGWDRLMETLKQRLAEQRDRHQGGQKWIGTAGTSPFGAYGYNAEGIRIGQEGGRGRSAVKVWDERTFRNLDDSASDQRQRRHHQLYDYSGQQHGHVPDALDCSRFERHDGIAQCGSCAEQR